MEENKPVIIEPQQGVTALIVQRVPPEKKDAFLEWQNGISAAAKAFAGYERTEVFPPVAGVQEDWVTVVHFRSNAELDVWLQSDARAEWNARFNEEFGTFDLKKFGYGFGFWFSEGADAPAGWKMVLTVLLGLYPSVILVNNVMMPFLKWLPFEVQLLIGNLTTVSMLQWLIMPVFCKWFSWWHKPARGASKNTDAKGAAIVIGITLVMTVVFTALKL